MNSDSVHWTIGSQHANSNGEFTGLDTDCGRINDEIHHEEIGDTAAGVATWCWNAQGDITRFEMGFDDDITWYTGAPGSITDQDYDLGAVAIHEVGHATGMAYHFVEPQDDCTGSETDDVRRPGLRRDLAPDNRVPRHPHVRDGLRLRLRTARHEGRRSPPDEGGAR